MDVPSNAFCSSGFHLPNGSYTTFGGNGAVGRGGNLGSQLNPGGYSAAWDAEYQDFDGSKSIRILNPCKNADNFADPSCQWFDNASILSMKKARWYSTAESLADGTIVLLGGFSTGGYINRNYPNTDPDSGGGSQNTYEFFPARDVEPPKVNFLLKTSGLNAYVHAFLMPSGKMFLQANYSSTLWDPETNAETALPDMPGNIVRVYPASGATAMLPLTPENNYTPTIIFCGGNDMPDEAWGDFSYPRIDTWNYPATRDCQRITPEPTDGSAPAYTKDDDLIEGRSMGQFIILPDGKLLVVNGALNGTAGYAQRTYTITSYADMPYGESLANGHVGTPAIYDPKAPAGQRWSNKGFDTSPIARMYHSSAMLLPDGSVLIAGSNPNVDVNKTTLYPTEYRAEVFYPPYFSATVRPAPSGIPSKLTYGGDPFDITIPASSYSGSANDAADNTVVAVMRGGFTTHAMNMGQRFLQLNNTYTVNQDGSIVLHCSQMPPIPEIFQPGPAWIYVTVKGIPSNGSYVIVGSGNVEAQTKLAVGALPGSVRLDSVAGTAGTTSTGNTGNSNGGSGKSSSMSTGTIVGAVVGAVAGLALLGALVGLCLARRNKAAAARETGAAGGYQMSAAGPGTLAASTAPYANARESDSSAFVPLNHETAWNASTSSLDRPYRDDGEGGRGSYDPYGNHHGTGLPQGARPY
ncbi:hypothetical protein D9611_007799 [Ephemerocybe angulata]|uniref:Copper radical oxidase n=1 Tax=Ephemerocybe angulata TaxID=980116 RepID=A0A8H5CEC4_9AGAR|nr:hypothetical protein D9611_007799 [Tulosesus angulatus]